MATNNATKADPTALLGMCWGAAGTHVEAACNDTMEQATACADDVDDDNETDTKRTNDFILSNRSRSFISSLFGGEGGNGLLSTVGGGRSEEERRAREERERIEREEAEERRRMESVMERAARRAALERGDRSDTEDDDGDDENYQYDMEDQLQHRGSRLVVTPAGTGGKTRSADSSQLFGGTTFQAADADADGNDDVDISKITDDPFPAPAQKSDAKDNDLTLTELANRDAQGDDDDLVGDDDDDETDLKLRLRHDGYAVGADVTSAEGEDESAALRMLLAKEAEEEIAKNQGKGKVTLRKLAEEAEEKEQEKQAPATTAVSVADAENNKGGKADTKQDNARQGKEDGAVQISNILNPGLRLPSLQHNDTDVDEETTATRGNATLSTAGGAAEESIELYRIDRSIAESTLASEEGNTYKVENFIPFLVDESAIVDESHTTVAGDDAGRAATDGSNPATEVETDKEETDAASVATGVGTEAELMDDYKVCLDGEDDPSKQLALKLSGTNDTEEETMEESGSNSASAAIKSASREELQEEIELAAMAAAVGQSCEVTLDKFESVVAASEAEQKRDEACLRNVELSRDHSRLVRAAEDDVSPLTSPVSSPFSFARKKSAKLRSSVGGGVASTAALVGATAAVGSKGADEEASPAASPSSASSRKSLRSKSPGRALATAAARVTSMRRPSFGGGSRSASRGRSISGDLSVGDTAEDLDTSQDIDNVVLGRTIPIFSVVPAGKDAQSLSSSPAEDVTHSSPESGSNLRRVSTLLDQLYGPSLTRERSDLRARMVLEKYEGKEDILEEVLKDKVSLQNDDNRATGRAAGGADMDAAATAAATAILAIQGNNMKQDTSDSVHLYKKGETTEERKSIATDSIAVPAAETKKKKKNMIRRSIRKVSKKVTRTEKVTLSEITKGVPESEADAPEAVPDDEDDDNSVGKEAADRYAAEVIEQDGKGEEDSIVGDDAEVQKLRDQCALDERIKSQLSYALSMDSAPGIGGHEITTVDGVQRFEGMPTEEIFEGEDHATAARIKTPSFAPVAMVDPIAMGLLPNNDKVEEDVSFEVDLKSTIKTGSSTNDGADLVLVSEPMTCEGGEKELGEDMVADADRADQGHLSSSHDVHLGGKSRSKLRFPSFSSRKQKQYVEMAGDF
eukprot:CAMPEP_0178631934 /NCGR_PEP_ID=MMETSP0698-20121128/11271_1 /TAXON_ID=265572 /ORGANISM="Extubocellulus spinifer, Strain CCMP396" /LENGTH=1149 /DNA_ID=CAMNT_0020271387 /DNA_START=333 /DNA_END=3782 /DNA_ORIENTATION=+